MLTVTTPATNFDLMTLASLKIAIDISNNDDDSFLRATLTRASDVISRHCKRIFAQETVVETLRLDQSRPDIVLARYPVTEITSVVEGATTVDASGYEISEESGVLRRLQGDGDRDGWWAATRITITYNAGFALPDAAPDALQQGCAQLVKAYYHARHRDPSLRSRDVPGINVSSFLDIVHLPHDVRGLLEPFRNYRCAA
jgi:uncharacterized phiE125 gp8 family phage protein